MLSSACPDDRLEQNLRPADYITTTLLVSPGLHLIVIFLHTLERIFALVCFLLHHIINGSSFLLERIQDIFYRNHSLTQNRTLISAHRSRLTFDLIFYVEEFESPWIPAQNLKGTTAGTIHIPDIHPLCHQIGIRIVKDDIIHHLPIQFGIKLKIMIMITKFHPVLLTQFTTLIENIHIGDQIRASLTKALLQ